MKISEHLNWLVTQPQVGSELSYHISRWPWFSTLSWGWWRVHVNELGSWVRWRRGRASVVYVRVDWLSRVHSWFHTITEWRKHVISAWPSCTTHEWCTTVWRDLIWFVHWSLSSGEWWPEENICTSVWSEN